MNCLWERVKAICLCRRGRKPLPTLSLASQNCWGSSRNSAISFRQRCEGGIKANPYPPAPALKQRSAITERGAKKLLPPKTRLRYKSEFGWYGREGARKVRKPHPETQVHQVCLRLKLVQENRKAAPTTGFALINKSSLLPGDWKKQEETLHLWDSRRQGLLKMECRSTKKTLQHLRPHINQKVAVDRPWRNYSNDITQTQFYHQVAWLGPYTENLTEKKRHAHLQA